MGLVLYAFLALFVWHVVSKAVAFRKLLKAIKFFPGTRAMTNVYGPIPFLIPYKIPYITHGRIPLFTEKYELFRRYGVDVISSLSTHPLQTVFVVSDPQVLKEMALSRARFPKPVEIYGTLSFYGSNIVASEHDEWKRYRKICSPGFSERNNRMVWDETVGVVTELFDDIWAGQSLIVVDNVLDITLAITLFIISTAGFGKRISWKDDAKPPGYQMAFKEVIEHMATGVFLMAITPKPIMALGLTKKMRDTNVAFKELGGYMHDMIQERRNAETKEERDDLFSNLLDASEAEADAKLKLSDTELMGNIYIFLVAGHETTGHTLAYALALLAMYPDEQEKFYQNARTIFKEGEMPGYEQVSACTYAMAVLYETLRMFPSVVGIPKRAAEDTVVRTTNADGEEVTAHIPKGAEILFDTPGLHYNPKYWEDPHTFNPSRFLDDWPRDAFMPFSGGPRACLGRRFAEIESVVMLSLFVTRYKIEIKEDPKYAHETFEEKKERVFRSQAGLTLTPTQISLVFKKR